MAFEDLLIMIPDQRLLPTGEMKKCGAHIHLDLIDKNEPAMW